MVFDVQSADPVEPLAAEMTLELILVGVVGDLAKLAEVGSAVREASVRLSRL